MLIGIGLNDSNGKHVESRLVRRPHTHETVVTCRTASRMVTVRHCEVLNHPPLSTRSEGCFYGELVNAAAIDTYILSADPSLNGAALQPDFTIHGGVVCVSATIIVYELSCMLILVRMCVCGRIDMHSLSLFHDETELS